MPTYRYESKRYAPGASPPVQMTEIPVLTCPVCGRSAGFARSSTEAPEALKDAAWDHLADHRLDESKRAIYAVMMVEQHERVALEAEAPLGDAAGEWREERPDRLAA